MQATWRCEKCTQIHNSRESNVTDGKNLPAASGLGTERRLPMDQGFLQSKNLPEKKKTKNMVAILFYMRRLWKWNQWQEETDAAGQGLAACYLKLSVVIQIDER